KNTSAKFGNDELGYSATAFGISHTLEYAYTDWCIAQLAKKLGKTEDEKLYLQKSQAFRNIFDEKIGWFRPKLKDGNWEPWPELGRQSERYGTIESNPYQLGWIVPHDVAGIVVLLGAKDDVFMDLSAFFDTTHAQLSWYDFYNHANEPVHC